LERRDPLSDYDSPVWHGWALAAQRIWKFASVTKGRWNNRARKRRKQMQGMGRGNREKIPGRGVEKSKKGGIAQGWACDHMT